MTGVWGELVGQDAAIDQLKVSAAGRKARVRRRVFALDLSGQARQAVQQRWLGMALGAADGLGQRGQFALGRAQHGSRSARRW